MATLEEAHYWRDQGYHPYRLATTDDGEELELISYPYPDDGGVYIQARQFNNPDTMRRYAVGNLSPLVQGMTVRELRRRIDHLKREHKGKVALLERQTLQLHIDRMKETLKHVYDHMTAAKNELVNRQKATSRMLLEYHDGQVSACYRVGSSWYAGKDVDQDLIQKAMDELRRMEQRRVPQPSAITDEMVREVLTLRVALLEWVS